MDPFEEFEFKPLTDGLGFHKKKPSVPKANIEEAQSETLFKNKSGDLGLDLIESPNDLRPPLPRKSLKQNQIPSSPLKEKSEGTTTVDEILKTLQKNRRFDFENSKEAAKAPTTKETFQATIWSFSAGVLDAMLVVAAALLCMIILLVITKVDLLSNLSNPDMQGMVYFATFAIFAGVAFIYLVLNRIYLGNTPGEWAFDQRVGKPEELNQGLFALKIVARSAVVIATGFVILPVLSVLFGKDIAGTISGARLYKKV